MCNVSYCLRSRQKNLRILNNELCWNWVKTGKLEANYDIVTGDSLIQTLGTDTWDWLGTRLVIQWFDVLRQGKQSHYHRHHFHQKSSAWFWFYIILIMYKRIDRFIDWISYFVCLDWIINVSLDSNSKLRWFTTITPRLCLTDCRLRSGVGLTWYLVSW